MKVVKRVNPKSSPQEKEFLSVYFILHLYEMMFTKLIVIITS